MKTLFFLITVAVGLVFLFRWLRQREIEQFMDADMSDFHAFKAEQAKLDQPDPLMAKAEAYAAMNPNVVTLKQQATDSAEQEAEIMPAAPDPTLFRQKSPAFDEVTRNMLSRLVSVVPDDVLVLHNVPLSEFVRTEDGEDAAFKLGTHRVGYLLCQKPDFEVICGIRFRDSGGAAQGSDFVRGVFGDIGKPLLDFPVAADVSALEIRDKLNPVLLSREIHECPKCGQSMTIRKAVKGKNAGEVFWVCNRFPNCRGVVRA